MPNVSTTALGERVPCSRGRPLMMLAVRHFSPVTFSADTGKKRFLKQVRRGKSRSKGFNSLRIKVWAETKDDGMEQRKSLRWSAGGRSAGSASGWLLHGRRRKEGVGSEKQRGLLCSASWVTRKPLTEQSRPKGLNPHMHGHYSS